MELIKLYNETYKLYTEHNANNTIITHLFMNIVKYFNCISCSLLKYINGILQIIYYHGQEIELDEQPITNHILKNYSSNQIIVHNTSLLDVLHNTSNNSNNTIVINFYN